MSLFGARRPGVSLELPCPGEHAGTVRATALRPADLPATVACSCGAEVALHRDCIADGGGLAGCLACGHPELFTRKDFPPAVGLAIVVLAAAAVPFLPKWYPSLIAAALLDLALYRFAPDVVVCYACGADHRGFEPRPRHPRFDRTIAERLRYGSRAVMGSPMRPAGTADAPEPEH